MGFWLLLAFWVFTTALDFLLRPRPKAGAPQPSAVGEFRKPTCEEGRAIGYLAGTGRIDGPAILWAGDMGTTPVVQSGVVTGHHFFMGLQYGLCLGPIDKVIALRFDDKNMPVAPWDIPPNMNLAVTAGGHVVIPLPQGSFLDGGSAAGAVTAKMQETADFRVAFGYQIVAGVNDTVYAYVGTSGGVAFGTQIASSRWRTASIRPGWYTPAALAAEVTNATAENWTLITSDGKSHTVTTNWLTATYDSGTGKFTIASTGITGSFWDYNKGAPVGYTLYMRAAVQHGSTTVLANLGIDCFGTLSLCSFDTNSPWVPYITGAETADGTFFFSIPAGCAVLWTHADTTCEAVFGMTSSGPDFTVSQKCLNSVASASESTSYTQFADSVRVVINAPSLFGGETDQGGITGMLDVYLGTDAQVPDDYLEAQLGSPPPAYRGVCYAVARRLYHGMSPYLKSIAFVVERIPNTLGLAGGKERIVVSGGASGDDANPACVIYELLTNERWGLGISPAMIDVGSFRAVGAVLWQEHFGVSILVDTAAEGLDLISEMLRHVDGVLFADPETGLLTLSLARFDFVPLRLAVFDESAVNNVTLSRASWQRLRNTVRVTFTDRSRGFTERSVEVQDLAGVQAAGYADVEQINYRAVSNIVTATAIGERLLATLGYPLAQVKFDCDRSAWRVRPGQPFVLVWPALGIQRMICRATKVSTGSLQQNRIAVEAVEDPYSLGHSRFGG